MFSAAVTCLGSGSNPNPNHTIVYVLMSYTQKKIVLCGSMWNRESSIRNRTVPNSMKRFNMS